MTGKSEIEHIFNEESLKEIGIYEHGYICTNEIQYGDEIRRICESNGCRLYATSWACPPAVGTLEECKKICLSFEHGMVFSSKYLLEDSFDIEGMRSGHKLFKKVCDRLFALSKEKDFKYLILSNEGCNRCKICTYPDKACRFPEMLFPSIEGFGIYVNKLAESANMHYMNGANTVTYFGMILF